MVWFGLVYLFNGISNPNGLFNAEIWFIRLIVIITLYIFNIQLLLKKYKGTFLYDYNNVPAVSSTPA